MPQRADSNLPWGRPRHELLLLVLIGLATLLPIYAVSPQDHSRLCLTRALAHAHLANDACFASSFDKSSYGGHLYSDKAPGMSVLELPVAEAVQLPPPPAWPVFGLRLWVIRILSSGLALLACAFLIGRIAEGLAPGFGAPSLVAFALGTLVAPFAAANFGHLAAAALGFGGFALAWRRRPLLAGLFAGAAVFVEYQAAVILVAVGVYVALQGGRSFARYAGGALPPVALLLLYDQLAFGAPWHVSYDYVSSPLATEQATGFFGVAFPHLFSTYALFSGNGGLLVLSPVLVAAAWGLVLLAREHRAEAILCAAVTIVFLLVTCGYYLPYGGVSPGPRFVIPALPFLAVGLGPAFASRPRLTALLTVLSVVPMTASTLVWANNNWPRQTIWGELARVPSQLGSSRYVHSLTPTVVERLGPGRVWGAAFIALCAVAALVVALRALPGRATRPRARTAVVVASLYAIAAADTCAVLAYPYRNDFAAGIGIELTAFVSGSATTAHAGDNFDFTAWAYNPSDRSVPHVQLRIELPAGMELITHPGGCTGDSRVVCRLGDMARESSANIAFAARITAIAPGQRLRVRAVPLEGGVASHHDAAFTVRGY